MTRVVEYTLLKYIINICDRKRLNMTSLSMPALYMVGNAWIWFQMAGSTRGL